MLRHSILCSILVSASLLNMAELTPAQGVQQSTEVLEAYRVCERFERALGKNLDFDSAYEATFTKSSARRRAIAITDGEFGERNFDALDDATIIKAYKLRMQIFYLMLPLSGPSDEEEALFFPPDIKEIIERKPPQDTGKFPSYVSQLERDVVIFRSHLNRLAAQYSSVAERISKFKSETLSASIAVPDEYRVKPKKGYLGAGVLGKNEDYYEIKGYIVARDGERMRIVGIKFFTRLI